MERVESSPSGGDGTERNFFRRNGGCIGPAIAGLHASPPARASTSPPQRREQSPIFLLTNRIDCVNFLNTVNTVQTAAARLPQKGRIRVISLNYRDSRPIYEQIKDGLRKLIVTGAIATDEKLPSVRALATQLSINPNTIQRAYNELEGEGYIYSVPGKGSFATGDPDADASRRQELWKKARELLAELRYLGVTQEELTELLTEAPSGGDPAGARKEELQ